MIAITTFLPQFCSLFYEILSATPAFICPGSASCSVYPPRTLSTLPPVSVTAHGPSNPLITLPVLTVLSSCHTQAHCKHPGFAMIPLTVVTNLEELSGWPSVLHNLELVLGSHTKGIPVGCMRRAASPSTPAGALSLHALAHLFPGVSTLYPSQKIQVTPPCFLIPPPWLPCSSTAKFILHKT